MPSVPISRRKLLTAAGGATALVMLGDYHQPAACAAAAPRRLKRVSPEAAGVSPEAVSAFIDAMEKSVGGLHSLMLLRHGNVAAEGWWAPYAPQLPHMLYSLSKSFTSTSVGLAVSEGKLTVEDRVTSFFPDRLPSSVSDNLSAMRVKHLLTMNTGHDKDSTGPVTAAQDGDWVRAFLALPVEHAPGSKFVYNSGATYMLSAIVQKLTGMRVADYLKPRLFDPLGITGQKWETCPKGINTGGWGLSVKTEDIARFGQLYLQKGMWGGRQLVTAAWVQEATSKQVSNGSGGASDWAQGYGYQFWRCRNNAYRGDGAFGQYCVVMPEQDAVLAITSGVGDMQAVLSAAWEHLLPGMQASMSGGSGDSLRRKLEKLEVSAPAGSAVFPAASRISGRTFRLASNPEKLETAEFDFSRKGCTLTLLGEARERRLTGGNGTWTAGQVRNDGSPPRLGAPPTGKTATRGAWTAEDTYTLKVCYVETPYVETITCRFSGDDVTIARKMNVSFGPTERPLLVGRLS
jgi:CubicO group peptidase (beta-lactamase class C family)